MNEKATHAVLSLTYLERVRERIADPAHWVEKSTRARNARGAPCDATDSDAVAWSLQAALEREQFVEERGFLGRRKLVPTAPDEAFFMAYITLGRQAFDRLDEIERAAAMIGGDVFALQRSVTPKAVCNYAIFKYTSMGAEGHARALEVLDAAIFRTRTEGPDERRLADEFPDSFVEECRGRFPQHETSESSEMMAFLRSATNGRSFPTDYPAWEGDVANAAEVAAHIAAVRDQLGPIDADRAQRVDYRVWWGPGDADRDALPHIDDAYHVALGVLERAGLLTLPPFDRLPALPALLDVVVRDVAQRMARDREGLGRDEALRRYGWDPYRIALEHGQRPGRLDELLGRTGLRASGSTCPNPK
jgi:hypothetical protein